jgi:hypothetical protein
MVLCTEGLENVEGNRRESVFCLLSLFSFRSSFKIISLSCCIVEIQFKIMWCARV